MTQITTNKIIVCPALSKEEGLIISANSGMKVKVISKKNLASEINSAITKVYNYCRFSIPLESDMKIMVDDMVKDISNYFTSITIEEINLAFHNGARKMYGEFAGISNAVMFEWLKKYTTSIQRQLAIKKQNEFLNPPPKVLTPEEEKAIIVGGCLKLFEEFKEKGVVGDYGNVNYRFLRSAGIINFTEGRRNEFKKHAQAILRQEAQERKVSAKGIYAIRDAIKQTDSANDINSTEVIAEAKRIALNTYFRELVEMGIELKDQINNNQNQNKP